MPRSSMALEETRVRLDVGAPRLLRGGDFIDAEVERPHRSDRVHDAAHLAARQDLPEPRGQKPRARLDPAERAGVLLERLEGRVSGGHRERMARVGPGLVDRALRCHELHEIGTAPEGRDGEPSADHLAERDQIRLDAVALRGASARGAESRHHLVEDEERAVMVAELPQARKEVRPGRDHTHVSEDRLEDHRGDPARLSRKGRFDGPEVVEGGDPRLRGDRSRNAGRVGHAERLEPRPSAYEKGIGVAVVATVELHDRVPLGRGARDADRGHGRLGPGHDEPQPLGGGVEAAHALGQRHLERVRHSEEHAGPELPLHRFDDGGMRVSEEHRSPAEHVVEELVLVRIGEIGPARRYDDARVSPHGLERPHRRVHASGEKTEGAIVDRLALLRSRPGASLHFLFLPRSGASSSAK